MGTRQFSQPNVVHALCLTVAKMHDAPALSTRILADAVVSKFPSAPLPVLRVIAAKVLRLYFEPVAVADIDSAGLNLDEAIAASKFFMDTLSAEAESFAQQCNRLPGSNVITLNAPAQT